MKLHGVGAGSHLDSYESFRMSLGQAKTMGALLRDVIFHGSSY